MTDWPSAPTSVHAFSCPPRDLMQLSERYGPSLSYLHLIETTRPFGSDKTWADPGDPFKMIEKYRPLFNGTVIAASGFTPAAAEDMVQKKGAESIRSIW